MLGKSLFSLVLLLLKIIILVNFHFAKNGNAIFMIFSKNRRQKGENYRFFRNFH
ncbi:hypothetical protein FC20_GL001380 [Lactobacillus equicursoris DSM 19284 = JCM 14600 = CIP 110162]|uniref:Uncharacterized protein n=1 Tax=Lactobacillus equicursoris DSM 19284 = JCM 14600 = CIP 110162 TaxID=1293597 RepID=A0A0R1LXN1_9LACO|nr:hypothetical protein FC20_GL001380 [Lactobacillus equicursoris DSM 19284 = JCM 14600 = CIP 110162]